MSHVKHPANGTEIVVEDLGIDGPEISELCFGRECEIGIIHPEWLVDTAGSYVGDHCCESRGKLLLYVEVPLRDIVALGIRLNIGCAQPVRREISVPVE